MLVITNWSDKMLNVYVWFECAFKLQRLLDHTSVRLQRALTDCYMTAIFSCNNKEQVYFPHICTDRPSNGVTHLQFCLSHHTCLGPNLCFTSVCDYWKGQDKTTSDMDNFPSIINHINPSPRKVVLPHARLQQLPALPDETKWDFM